MKCEICKIREAGFLCANQTEVMICGYCLALCDIERACIDEVSTLEIHTNNRNYFYIDNFIPIELDDNDFEGTLYGDDDNATMQ